MFKPFTLTDVYAYAAERGYTREDVEIRLYEYLDGTVTYTVEFGVEYTEMWSWEFDDLDGEATDYEHLVW